MSKANILKYLKHFAILAGLGAASVILLVLLQMIGSLNVTTLPIVWQGVAYLFLPVIVAAGMKLKAELDAELAAEEAKKELALEKAKNVYLAKSIMEMKAMEPDKSGLGIDNKGQVY